MPGAWLRARLVGRAATAQLGGVAFAWAMALLAAAFGGTPSRPVMALAHGAAAALIGRMLGLPGWWAPLNFVLPVLAWNAGALDIDPLWYLGAFGVTFLVFGTTTIRSGVPLYLSGPAAAGVLSGLVPAAARVRVLDAGSGVGSVLAQLSAMRPDAVVSGIESAIVPWLLSRLRAATCGGRFRVSLGDFWDADFGNYDFVYAYLSPAAMPRLWHKARREMHPGTMLVSNSFEIPGVPATRTIELGPRARHLYVWRM
jgi:hypothetical protein